MVISIGPLSQLMQPCIYAGLLGLLKFGDGAFFAKFGDGAFLSLVGRVHIGILLACGRPLIPVPDWCSSSGQFPLLSCVDLDCPQVARVPGSVSELKVSGYFCPPEENPGVYYPQGRRVEVVPSLHSNARQVCNILHRYVRFARSLPVAV